MANINIKDSLINKNMGIRKWYMRNYPSDTLGRHITKRLSFAKFYSAMRAGWDPYKLLGIGDSVVRERVFRKLAEIERRTYEDIYNTWAG